MVETVAKEYDRTNRQNHNIEKTLIPNKQTEIPVYRYRDALNYAHQNGLIGFETALVIELCDVAANYYVARATAYFADGTKFDGIGDANPENVNSKIVRHLPRMAETRAKARALGDALNLDANFADEFGGEDEVTPAKATSPVKEVKKETYQCENCGVEITDSSKYTAAQKAEFSRQKNNGAVLCYTCGR
jgi:hypothetical protein